MKQGEWVKRGWLLGVFCGAVVWLALLAAPLPTAVAQDATTVLLTIRLRDLVLSLGAGVTDKMAPGALDFEVGGKFARLAPDSAGVTLSLLGPLGSPLPDLNGRLTPHAKGG